jgi:hypothetical protein
MVHRLFLADTRRLSAEDALVVSAIRGVGRPLHLAFHAATVATELASFYAAAGRPDEAERLRGQVRSTLHELDGRRRFLSPRGERFLDVMLTASAA